MQLHRRPHAGKCHMEGLKRIKGNLEGTKEDKKDQEGGGPQLKLKGLWDSCTSPCTQKPMHMAVPIILFDFF